MENIERVIGYWQKICNRLEQSSLNREECNDLIGRIKSTQDIIKNLPNLKKNDEGYEQYCNCRKEFADCLTACESLCDGMETSGQDACGGFCLFWNATKHKSEVMRLKSKFYDLKEHLRTLQESLLLASHQERNRQQREFNNKNLMLQEEHNRAQQEYMQRSVENQEKLIIGGAAIVKKLLQAPQSQVPQLQLQVPQLQLQIPQNEGSADVGNYKNRMQISNENRGNYNSQKELHDVFQYIRKACEEYLEAVNSRNSITNVGRHDVKGKKERCKNLLELARDCETAKSRGLSEYDIDSKKEKLLTDLSQTLVWLDKNDHWNTELRGKLQGASDRVNHAVARAYC